MKYFKPRHVLISPLAAVLLLATVISKPLLADDNASKLARDRQAILAMAGEYHVIFDFEETVALRKDYELKDAYHSEGTEFVEVIADQGDFISLQHILVMDDEDTGESHVVKHWRQDWQYQPQQILAYQGHSTWSVMPVTTEHASGAWSQSVWQVDDSPRYSGVGQWQHNGDYSAWTSDETWRPLPRREYTQRDDYHVLVAQNRHVITPNGWVHEQDNSKLDLDNNDNPYLARELGVNQYIKIKDHDFSAGYEYWQQTQNYWSAVRNYWNNLVESKATVSLAAEVDGKKLHEKLFEQAEEFAAADAEKRSQLVDGVDAVIDRFMSQRTVASQSDSAVKY